MTKEELEELIKNKKDIWCYFVANKNVERLNDYYDFENCKITEKDLILGDYEFYFPLKYLFSTKEQAREKLK